MIKTNKQKAIRNYSILLSILFIGILFFSSVSAVIYNVQADNFTDIIAKSNLCDGNTYCQINIPVGNYTSPKAISMTQIINVTSNMAYICADGAKIYALNGRILFGAKNQLNTSYILNNILFDNCYFDGDADNYNISIAWNIIQFRVSTNNISFINNYVNNVYGSSFLAVGEYQGAFNGSYFSTNTNVQYNIFNNTQSNFDMYYGNDTTFANNIGYSRINTTGNNSLGNNTHGEGIDINSGWRCYVYNNTMFGYHENGLDVNAHDCITYNNYITMPNNTFQTWAIKTTPVSNATIFNNTIVNIGIGDVGIDMESNNSITYNNILIGDGSNLGIGVRSGDFGNLAYFNIICHNIFYNLTNNVNDDDSVGLNYCEDNNPYLNIFSDNSLNLLVMGDTDYNDYSPIRNINITNYGANLSNGKYVNGVRFSNKQGYVTYGDLNSLEFKPSGFSAIFWYKLNSRETSAHIIDKKNGGTNNQGYRIETSASNSNNWRFQVQNETSGTSTSIDTGIQVENGNWGFYALIVNATGKNDIIIFDSGQVKMNSTFNWSGSFADTNSFNLGRQLNGSINGTIDDITIFGRALSLNEIKSIYYSNHTLRDFYYLDVLNKNNNTFYFINLDIFYNRNISIVNSTKSLIYFSNNSGFIKSGDFNLILSPNNYSYVLDNFNLTEGITRDFSPLSFSQSSSTSKHIASNLTENVNVTIVLSNIDCTKIGIINYHTDSNNYTRTYNPGDYTCTNNQIQFDNIPVEPAQNSNIFTLQYNQATINSCNSMILSFLSFPMLIGLIGTVFLIGLVLTILFGYGSFKSSEQVSKGNTLLLFLVIIGIGVLIIIGIAMINGICSLGLI